MTLDLLLNTMELVPQGLPGVTLLHGQHRLEGLLFRAQDLHLLFVGAKLLLKLPHSLIETVQLPLKMSCVVGMVLGVNAASECALLL